MGWGNAYHHEYELYDAKACTARARNKCKGCGRAIKSGEKYVLCFILDTCKHRVRNSVVGFNEQKKFCNNCLKEVLALAETKGFFVSKRYYERAKVAITEVLGRRPSRYELLLDEDPLQEILSTKGQ